MVHPSNAADTRRVSCLFDHKHTELTIERQRNGSEKYKQATREAIRSPKRFFHSRSTERIQKASGGGEGGLDAQQSNIPISPQLLHRSYISSIFVFFLYFETQNWAPILIRSSTATSSVHSDLGEPVLPPSRRGVPVG